MLFSYLLYIDFAAFQGGFLWKPYFHPGRSGLENIPALKGAYMFSVGWKPDLAIKERIRKNDHYVEQSP